MTADRMPIGWGYGPGEGRQVAPLQDVPVEKVRRSSRRRASNDRRMHMRFALWAARLNRPPMPGEAADELGVCYETARRLVWDWEKLTKEESQ